MVVLLLLSLDMLVGVLFGGGSGGAVAGAGAGAGNSEIAMPYFLFVMVPLVALVGS